MSATKNKVLSDHRKIGRKFVPPMMQIQNVKDVSFASHAMPEFLWLAILNHYYGWQKGVELSLSLAFAASEATGIKPSEFKKNDGKSPKEMFSVTSAYNNLTKKEKSALIAKLKHDSQWELIVEALSPLLSWYPQCPLNFITENASLICDANELERLKAVVKPLYTKTSKEAVAMYANAIYIAGATNKLRFMKGSSMENFPEIERYPETDESKAIAASVRAMVLASFGMHVTSPEWGNYFWNRGLEIDACSI